MAVTANKRRPRSAKRRRADKLPWQELFLFSWRWRFQCLRTPSTGALNPASARRPPTPTMPTRAQRQPGRCADPERDARASPCNPQGSRRVQATPELWPDRGGAFRRGRKHRPQSQPECHRQSRTDRGFPVHRRQCKHLAGTDFAARLAGRRRRSTTATAPPSAPIRSAPTSRNVSAPLPMPQARYTASGAIFENDVASKTSSVMRSLRR